MRVTNKSGRTIAFGLKTMIDGASDDFESVTPAMRLMAKGRALDIDEGKKPRGKPADPTDREKGIMAAIEGLTAEDLTQDGKPEVDAINALIEGEPVTAAERDAVWAKRK